MPHDDHDLAAALATEAGRVLLALRAQRGFADPKALKDAGDLASHEYLMAELAKARPSDAVLSEEGKDDLARLSHDRVWIVDPLDGTREFGEEGRSDWAVHVALWAGGRLAAGAVSLPARDLTLATAPPDERGGTAVTLATAGRDGRTPVSDAAPESAAALAVPEPRDPVRIAVSRSRPPAFVQALAEALPLAVELVPIGSAGAKISAVLLGEVDAYVHAGGQYEWDNAAPAAVALAAGAHASRIDGSALTYNHEHPELPDILVCHPALAPVLLAGIRDVGPA